MRLKRRRRGALIAGGGGVGGRGEADRRERGVIGDRRGRGDRLREQRKSENQHAEKFTVSHVAASGCREEAEPLRASRLFDWKK